MTAPIWSEESGPSDAPLIALVHGSMDRSAGLLRLSRRLDERFRVLRYDRRGYGRSAPHPGPFSIDEQVADLLALLGGRRAVLFGHSYGGNVALATADRHPELVAAVGVYETPLSWFGWWPAGTAGAAAVEPAGDPADAAEVFMRRLVGDDKWSRLPPSTRLARRAEGVAMVGELASLRAAPAWDPARIGVPVVAMFGEHGAAHHREGTRTLGELLADCQVVQIDDARHFGPNTHADAVAAHVAALASVVRDGDERDRRD